MTDELLREQRDILARELAELEAEVREYVDPAPPSVARGEWPAIARAFRRGEP